MIKRNLILDSRLPRNQSEKRKRNMHIFHVHKSEKGEKISVGKIKSTHREKLPFEFYVEPREGSDSFG